VGGTPVPRGFCLALCTKTGWLACFHTSSHVFARPLARRLVFLDCCGFSLLAISGHFQEGDQFPVTASKEPGQMLCRQRRP
jgi:hypothetical protein